MKLTTLRESANPSGRPQGALVHTRLELIAALAISLFSLSALTTEAAPSKETAGKETAGADQAASAQEAKASIEEAAKEAERAQGEDEEESGERSEEGSEEETSEPQEANLGPLKTAADRIQERRAAQGAKASAKASPKKKRAKRRKRRFPTKRPKRALKAAPPLGKIPFSLGERLVYKVNMLNAHSGTVTLKVGKRGTYQGKRVVELSGFIQSSPFLENFYPIRDSLSVLVDEVSFLPMKSEFFLNEQKRKITFVSEYEADNTVIKWQQSKEVKGKTQKRSYTHKAPSAIYESLSSLYALRRLTLKPGLEFERYVWDGKRERLIGVKVLGEERILTDLGWFDTYKVELSSVITGGIVSRRLLRQAPVKGTAWVAKDAAKTPVKLMTPTRLGEAEAIITQRSVEAPQ